MEGLAPMTLPCAPARRSIAETSAAISIRRAWHPTTLAGLVHYALDLQGSPGEARSGAHHARAMCNFRRPSHEARTRRIFPPASRRSVPREGSTEIIDADPKELAALATRLGVPVLHSAYRRPQGRALAWRRPQDDGQIHGRSRPGLRRHPRPVPRHRRGAGRASLSPRNRTCRER